MSDLVNLIVPPIIIVVAIALLLVFLARVIPHSEEKLNRFKLKRKSNKISESSNSDNFVANNLEDKEEDEYDDFSLNREIKSENMDEKLNEDRFNRISRSVDKNNDIHSNNKLKSFFSNFNLDVLKKFFSSKKLKSKNRLKGFRNSVPERLYGVKSSISKGFVSRNLNINSVNNEKNDSASENKSQVSGMGEILLNNKSVPNKTLQVNEESELVKQISLDPKNPESFRRLGDFYVRNDRLQEARECYKWVLRLDPRHKRAQLAMARLDRILD